MYRMYKDNRRLFMGLTITGILIVLAVAVVWLIDSNKRSSFDAQQEKEARERLVENSRMYAENQAKLQGSFRVMYNAIGGATYELCVVGQVVMGINVDDTDTTFPVALRSMVQRKGWRFESTDTNTMSKVLMGETRTFSGVTTNMTATGAMYSRMAYTVGSTPSVKDLHLWKNLEMGMPLASPVTETTEKIAFINVEKVATIGGISTTLVAWFKQKSTNVDQWTEWRSACLAGVNITIGDYWTLVKLQEAFGAMSLTQDAILLTRPLDSLPTTKTMSVFTEDMISSNETVDGITIECTSSRPSTANSVVGRIKRAGGTQYLAAKVITVDETLRQSVAQVYQDAWDTDVKTSNGSATFGQVDEGTLAETFASINSLPDVLVSYCVVYWADSEQDSNTFTLIVAT
jgi:hypothetical protein